MKNKIIAVAMLLIVFAVTIVPLEVSGQGSLGVNILQITPSSAQGSVGSSINIQGTIYTSNGTYRLTVGNTVVASDKSEGFYVNANFTIPNLPAGTYALTLTDIAINVNSTKQFTITTGYLVNVTPNPVQEGNGVTVNVTVAAGQVGTAYSANIAISLPSPLGTSYSKTVAMGTTDQKGTVSAQVTFPDASFQPSGSVIDYAGTYSISFNQSLAQGSFIVNFIDSTTYHRGQTVLVHATGYQPSQTATITITSSVTGSTHATLPVTASSDGVISTSWVVSPDTPIGDCIIKITPDGTQKLVQDSQSFSVIGYSVQVKTTNLAGQNVAGIAIQALDTSTNTIYNATSDSNGVANIKLEKGSYTVTAFWNGVNVGQTSITVTGDGTFSVQCQLTNLKITVKNVDGVAMPFVTLNIAYQYQSGGTSKSGSAQGQTDATGSFTLNSTLTGANYLIDASVYSQIFNAGNNTVNSLPNQATAQVFIIAPSDTFTLTVVGYNEEPISGARIELVELSNGLFYSATTNTGGSATTQATFGMYRARVFKGNALINETNVQIFSNSQQQIRCTLFGIQLSVKVVDLLGSPITNANVTISGPQKASTTTQSDGVAIFNNIIGGNMQIIAQASSTPDAYQATVITVNEPSTVQVKIDKYITLGPVLVQATALITVLVVLIALILFAVVEVYRRTRAKHT